MKKSIFLLIFSITSLLCYAQKGVNIDNKTNQMLRERATAIAAIELQISNETKNSAKEKSSMVQKVGEIVALRTTLYNSMKNGVNDFKEGSAYFKYMNTHIQGIVKDILKIQKLSTRKGLKGVINTTKFNFEVFNDAQSICSTFNTILSNGKASFGIENIKKDSHNLLDNSERLVLFNKLNFDLKVLHLKTSTTLFFMENFMKNYSVIELTGIDKLKELETRYELIKDKSYNQIYKKIKR